jgi:AI-2 transport protein TqsA
MSDPRRERWTLITASVVILATVAVGFVLWFTRSVMIPFVLAVFVVAVVAPIADWLEVKARFRRWMSVPLVLAIVLVFSAGVLSLFTYTAQEVAVKLPGYAEDISDLLDAQLKNIESAPPNLNEANNTPPSEELEQGSTEPDATVVETVVETTEDVATEGWNVVDSAKEYVKAWLIEARANWKREVMPTIKAAIPQVLEQIGTTISTFALMMIFVFFLLVARDPSRLKLTDYAIMEHKIRRYLLIKLGMSALTGMLVAVILAYLGMPLVIVFGVLTFLLNFVPSIGSMIATLLPVPVAAAAFVLEKIQSEPPEPANWWMVLAVLVLPGTVQIVIGNVLEPRVMGEGLELNPIVILIGLVFWTLLWGPVGAILAVPIIAVIRIATARWVSLKPVSDLMAGQLPG